MNRKQLGTSILAVALAFCLSNCTDNDVYQGPKEEEKEFNDFEFTTVQKEVDLEVSYRNSEVEANVYFELYTEMPVTLGEYNYIKRDDVAPLFVSYTADNSVFKGKVELPAYAKKVYIYTPAFFAQTLIEADVVNGKIVAADYNMADSQTRLITPTGTSYDSYMVSKKYPTEYSDKRWKNWLGNFDKRKNGAIDYTYSGDLAAKENDNLYTAHTKVININKSCPEEYRSYSDMYINKDASVAVTFLGQNTCWNCSMGYYYYREGEKPASLNDANVIMLFPNTQDGLWTVDAKAAEPTAGINRLTAVQLKYYPNIASGSEANASDVFPAGYRIGFVLANNSWSNRIKNYGSNNRYRAATSEGLSVDNNGRTINKPRTAVYKYGDWLMFSFEDFTSDENFSDVVMTMKSNPVDAIIDVPIVDPEDNKTTVGPLLQGTYAFEDLWPNKGDYDMNDVVVRYDYGKTFDIENKIYTENFTFKTFQNIAANNNGLAVRLATDGTVSSATVAMRQVGKTEFEEIALKYEAADNVYILTDNVKDNMNGEYKITVEYSTPATKQSSVEPFIFKNTQDGKRWEVHLPKHEPTSKVDAGYFGQGDDASNPSMSVYYVRSGNYPFAFYLSGADENDLAPILTDNESVAIDQVFSGYSKWVESGGTTNQDWYKK